MLAVAISPGCAPDPPSAAVGIVVDSCDPGDDTGSGALVGPGLVLTSAHVVAGADAIRVVRDGQTRTAHVVAFDPEMDLAYLAVNGWDGTPWSVSSEGVEAGDTGVAYVMRDGGIAKIPVAVVRRVDIRTEDIYVEGETVRPGFELEASIEPGDSGGAVVIDGRIAGVVWARSRQVDDRSYAIDADRGGALIREQLHMGSIGDDIDPARCH